MLYEASMSNPKDKSNTSVESYGFSLSNEHCLEAEGGFHFNSPLQDKFAECKCTKMPSSDWLVAKFGKFLCAVLIVPFVMC